MILMAVLKNRTQKDFTMISNLILRDKGLTMKERGVLCTICSLPDGWDFSLTGLSTIVPDGIDSIRAGVRSLERKGYLERRRIRSDDGKYAVEVEVYDRPHGIIRDGKTNTEDPTRKKRDGKADTENPTQYNTDNIKLNIKTDNNISIINKDNGADGSTDDEAWPDEDAVNENGEKPELEKYRSLIADNIKLDWLLEAAERHNEDEVTMAREIYDLICDMVCFKRDKVDIKGVSYPWETVKSRFLKLQHEHVVNVLNRLVDKNLGIKNMYNYVISSLFTESLVGTMQSNADLYDEYLRDLRGNPYDS